MSLREEIIQQALGLPSEDREFVADTLEQSLPHADFASPEIAATWSEEIDRRMDEADPILKLLLLTAFERLRVMAVRTNS